MITAFLDGAGKLGDAERRIDLVYYDIRDIAFEDSGLTPRMMDAITSMGRRTGSTGSRPSPTYWPGWHSEASR